MNSYDRLLSEVKHSRWLAPVVRSEILKCKWGALAKPEIAEYLDCLRVGALTVEKLAGQSEDFKALIDKYAEPQALEAELSGEADENLGCRLLAAIPLPVSESLFSHYLTLNLQALGNALGICGIGDFNADDR